jgi:hypothetical protein
MPQQDQNSTTLPPTDQTVNQPETPQEGSPQDRPGRGLGRGGGKGRRDGTGGGKGRGGGGKGGRCRQ